MSDSTPPGSTSRKRTASPSGATPPPATRMRDEGGPPPTPPPQNDPAEARETMKKLKEMQSKGFWSMDQMNEMFLLRRQLRVNAEKASNEEVRKESEEATLSDRQRWIRNKKKEIASGQSAASSSVAAGQAPKFPDRKTLRDIEWETGEFPPFGLDAEELEELGLELPYKDAATGEVYKWTWTKRGGALFERLANDSEARDPDNFDVYINNDWASYGQIEVMESWIAEWFKEFRKASPLAEELYIMAEGFLLWIARGYTQWYMADDGQRTEALMVLVSDMLYATFRLCRDQHLLHPASPLKNVEMVAALMYHWGVMSEECEWGAKQVMALVKGAGREVSFAPVELGEDYKLEKFLAGWEEMSRREQGDTWWKAKKKEIKEALKDYKEEFVGGGKLGGNRFDLKRLSKAQREKLDETQGIAVLWGEDV